ncbi:HNH endonuclease [Arenibacterium halophilum]|uniref:HNH endonuclease n=1 Tax=Arenibacterium halophilum TaxID=2583821 RepID=A0ABY2XBQ7_9RHOB|nr:HNH endonuclease [Arenibacterium halophilum]TMV13309.1 HNH endonuclease [Arenibacterium halophilum]
MSKYDILREISRELETFDAGLKNIFKCPICLRDLPVGNIDSKDRQFSIDEEHIIPKSVGGKITIFLCKSCNNTAGSKHTKWLGEYIEIFEGKAPFHASGKKQKATATADGYTINGTLKVAEGGDLEFVALRSHSHPHAFEGHVNAPSGSKLTVQVDVPAYRQEKLVGVGFLAAAYELWFKNFGYSFVLQKSLDIVREQISNPEEDIIDWCYTIDTEEYFGEGQILREPAIGVMRFGQDHFAIAVIFNQIVILPSPTKQHPDRAHYKEIRHLLLSLKPQIAPRFQNRCTGPGYMICGDDLIVRPDMVDLSAKPVRQVIMPALQKWA